MAPTLTAFDTVRARIARAMLPALGSAALGRFTLREPQRQSVAQIRRALETYGGALVAEPVGSGKTVLALAVAAPYSDVLVLAPAAIREQWRRAAVTAGVRLRVRSHNALSRGDAPAAAPLIIVDEAHHLRTPRSQRYRTLARLCTGRHLLLLTATPVVNRRADRDALLALFLGTGPRAPDVLERVVLRRTATTASGVRVRRLPPLDGASDVPGLHAALAALPPPLPLADGRAATALIQLTLAMAWSSSLAALDAALRRRVQRGAAISDLLRAGRWPSRDTLRDWIIGADATQLAFTYGRAELEQAPPNRAHDILAVHLAAVRALRAMVAPHVLHDIAARSAALQRLLAEESPRRVVLLAQHAETVRALYSALRSMPGVIAITGTRVHAAAGRWSREEVLQALGPGVAPWRGDDARGIRLLLATDILAEGVELQGCATIIHGDPAWTPARLDQRVGRVAREGQTESVHVLRFRHPPGAEALLTLGRRLLRKRQARRQALTVSTEVAALQRALEAWAGADAPRAGAASVRRGAVVAAATATHDGFIAVLEDETGERHHVIAGIHAAGRWRVRRGASTLRSLVMTAGDVLPVRRDALAQVRHIIGEWRSRARSRLLLHGDAASASATSLPTSLLRQTSQRLDAWLVQVPLAQRAAATARVARVRAGVAALRGAGAESAITAALRESAGRDGIAALEHLLVQAPTKARVAADRISALLLLHRPAPAAPAPPTPSSESAVTR